MAIGATHVNFAIVSPEEAGIAPEMFKSRQQSLSQPLTGFEFTNQSG
jgi:hypothetical protein